MKNKILPTAVLTTMIALGGVTSPAFALSTGGEAPSSETKNSASSSSELGLGHLIPGPKTPLIKSADGSVNLPETHEEDADLISATGSSSSFTAVNPESAAFGAAATAQSQGDIKVTMVTVKLADRTLAQTRAMNSAAMDSAIVGTSNYWKSMSNNRISTSVESKRLEISSSAKSTDDYPTIMNTIRREIGWTDGAYKALVVFIPVDSLSYGGYGGYLGAGWSSAGVGGSVLMPTPSSLTTSVVAHEYGHMLGLLHANSLQCTNGRADVGINSSSQWADGACSSREYGDTVDLMGSSQLSMPAINSFFWDKGGFGRGDEVLNAGVASGSKTYTLKPWAGSGSNRAVKFLDPKSQETYYLELRTPVGYDSSVATGGNRGVKIVKEDIANKSWAPKSVNLNPSTKPWGSYYNPNHAWQAGSTFTTHGGITVKINSVTDSGASVTVSTSSPYVSYFKYANDTTIYGKFSDGSFKALNWAEYSSLGEPSYQTLPAVYFVKNTWSSNIYAVGSDNKGQALNFQDWDAYGRPNPTASQLVPGTYFTTKFDNKLYYMSPAGEIPATEAEWKAAGSPTVKLPVRYIKYSWDTTLYRQAATSMTSSTVSAVNYGQWSSEGFPSPETVDYIPGTTFFKFSDLGTVFMKSPSGAIHAATYPEWKAAPDDKEGYSDAGLAKFVKNTWSSNIYLVGADNMGVALNFQEWDSYGRPNPTSSQLVDGSYFVSKSDGKLYYMSPDGELPATDADWKAAGSPTIRKG